MNVNGNRKNGGFLSTLTSLIVLSYLEESLKILERHSGYFHEDVRLQAIISLKREYQLHATSQLILSTILAILGGKKLIIAALDKDS